MTSSLRASSTVRTGLGPSVSRQASEPMPRATFGAQGSPLFEFAGVDPLTLLCLSSGHQGCCGSGEGGVRVEGAEEFAGDVALEAALDLAAGLALGCAA